MVIPSSISRDERRPASEKRESVQNQGNGRRRVTLKGPTPEELRSQSPSMLSYWLRQPSSSLTFVFSLKAFLRAFS